VYQYLDFRRDAGVKATVRHVARNVKRWQGGERIARWPAAGLLEAEKKFGSTVAGSPK
jgi:hypothetical protein